MQNHRRRHHQQQQQEEEEEEENGENYRTFGWFNLLLSVVAAVVAVLAMAVLVGAVMVMRSQPYLLDISVVHGVVPVDFQWPPSTSMTLYLCLAASNLITNQPSKVSFTGIDITVNDDENSMPQHFTVDDIVDLMPGYTRYVSSPQNTSDNPAADVGNYFFGKLKNNESTSINLRLKGVLTIELFPFNGTGAVDRPPLPKITTTAIYSCLGVVLGVDSSLNNNGNDVSCSIISLPVREAGRQAGST